MKQYYPGGDPYDSLNMIGYATDATVTRLLKQAGDNLTRGNLMDQAAHSVSRHRHQDITDGLLSD